VKKEVLLSAFLFAIGLGFFLGFKEAYQQIITIILSLGFIALPIYFKLKDLFQQLFKQKKQHEAAL
jgi:ABC-type polysaccharide/polyol phosphate export permease